MASSPLPTRRRRPAASGRSRRRESFWAAVFLAPALLALITLRLAPTVEAVISSLYRAFPGGLVPPTFAGGANYAALFGDPNFRATIVRTVVFNVVINPLQVLLALGLALLLVQRVVLRGLWRTLLFVPVTVPIVGSCIAWGAALNPQGPVNALIQGLRGHPQPFLTSPKQALASIILIASWIGIGYWMQFLISGLEAIPQEIYEAARLDRAGWWATLIHVTLPLLKRPLLFVLVADTVANFVLFVPIQLLTAGGPQNSTTLLMFDAYQTTFTFGSRSQGAAEVVVLTLIMLAFVIGQFRLLREDSDGGYE